MATDAEQPDSSPTSKAKVKEYHAESFYENQPGGLTERDRLGFAKQILICLFILVAAVFAASYGLAAYYGDHNPELIKVVNTILDITKTVVPATVTLVLGFYFGKQHS